MHNDSHSIPKGTRFTIMGLPYTVIDTNYCVARSYLVRTPTGVTVWMYLGQ